MTDYKRWDAWVRSQIVGTALSAEVATTITRSSDSVESRHGETLYKEDEIRSALLAEMDDGAIWQCVVDRLPCFISDKSNRHGIVRPYVFMIGCLYPSAKLISYNLCAPLDGYPSARDACTYILQAITKDDTHRPQHITFANDALTRDSAASLASIDIQCSTLSQADGFAAILTGMASSLIEEKFALPLKPASPISPSLAASGLPDSLIHMFYILAAQLSAVQPWNIVPEQQSIAVAVCTSTPEEACWVTVVGQARASASAATEKVVASGKAVANSSGEADASYCGPVGIVVNFSRHAVQKRIASGPGVTWAHSPFMARCFACDKPGREFTEASLLAKGAPEVYSPSVSEKSDASTALMQCSACKSAFYCGADCQKADWKRHKPVCSRIQANVDSEIAVYFRPLEFITAPDEDYLHRNNLLSSFSEGNIPIVATMHHATRTLRSPTQSELVDVLRCMLAVGWLCGLHPRLARNLRPFLRRLELPISDMFTALHTSTKIPAVVPEGIITCMGDAAAQLTVRCDPVLVVAQQNALFSALRSKLEASTATEAATRDG